MIIPAHQISSTEMLDSLEGTFTLQTIVVYLLASGVIKRG